MTPDQFEALQYLIRTHINYHATAGATGDKAVQAADTFRQRVAEARAMLVDSK